MITIQDLIAKYQLPEHTDDNDLMMLMTSNISDLQVEMMMQQIDFADQIERLNSIKGFIMDVRSYFRHNYFKP